MFDINIHNMLEELFGGTGFLVIFNCGCNCWWDSARVGGIQCCDNHHAPKGVTVH